MTTINANLKTILGTQITVGSGATAKTVPVAHLRYRGNASEYIVWTITRERATLCADDDELYEEGEVDIDVYSVGDIVPTIAAIKTLLKNNDYTWVEDSTEMYEEDTQMYHRTITFTKGNDL